MRTAKALARLSECAGLPEPSMVACVVSTTISLAGSFSVFKFMNWAHFVFADMSEALYHKNLKKNGHPKNCCKYPKI